MTKSLPPPQATARSLPPPPEPTNGRRHAVEQQQKHYTISRGVRGTPQRVLIYGPGGIGKSTLASLCPDPVFIDVEDGTGNIDVQRVDGVSTFADLRSALHSSVFDDCKSIVIDSATRVEEMAVAHTIEAVPHEKGHRVSGIEGYGYGKGLQYVYDTFMLLVADLDSQIRRGRNVILIAHACVDGVPNPVGEDWIRYEPQMQSPRSGKASIRNRVVQWADHILYVGYDVVAKDGKGLGAGTRTIYTYELPSHVAKSRTTRVALPFESATDGRIWPTIIGGK